jgi:hypothetical protein
MGFSVFPCNKDKTPSLKWLGFQKERASEEQIRKWWGNGSTSPIAIVTGKISGVVVVDVDDTDIGFKNLANYIPPGVKTPMAKTPSGGYHLFFKLPDVEVRNNARAIPGCDFRGEGGYVIASPSFCSYEKSGKRIEGLYEWQEGFNINDLALEDLNPLYISYINSYSYIGATTTGNTNTTNNNKTQQNTTEYFIEGRRDEDLFSIANALIKGGCKTSIAMQAMRIIANSCNPPFPEKEIDIKIKSAMDRVGRKDEHMMQEITEYVNTTNGNFYSTEVSKILQYTTADQIKKMAVYLGRLKEKKIIERVPPKNGCWRKIDVSYEVMDIAAASGKPIDKFRYPLGIEKHARTYPKNIVTINGFANQGKSAFVFEIARMNQKLFPGRKPRFLSSEAGVDEIKEKLSFYPQDINTLNLDWWIKNIEFIEKHDTWWDIVDPDGLNIIDYISDYQEAYKIPHYINEILKKLNKGVAVVVMQRDPAKMNSHGGQATRHAARLAIDIEFKKCVLTKVKGAIKHSPDYKHPDGLARRFELKDIWKIEPTSEWYWPEDEKLIENKKKYADYGVKDDVFEEEK